MNVLITGAGGAVGPRVVDVLCEAGYTVRTFSLDRPRSGRQTTEDGRQTMNDGPAMSKPVLAMLPIRRRFNPRCKGWMKSVIVVTSWYHTRRAANVIQHSMADTNISVYISSSTNLPFTPDNWWKDEEGLVAVINEMIKTALYWRRHGIAP